MATHAKDGAPAPVEQNKDYQHIGPFRFAKGDIDVKQESILEQLQIFYTKEHLKSVLVPIITQKDAVSLRVLDWLVTNYSKKNNIVYMHRVEGKSCLINIYSTYKNWLRNFRRRNFDPFRRRSRIEFTLEEKSYTTTVGQLNFIYWSHLYGILDYTREHLKGIEEDMNRCLNVVRATKRKSEQNGLQYKRRELSSHPRNKCFIYSSSSVTWTD